MKEQLIEFVCKKYDITLYDMQTSKKHDVVKARDICMKLLHDYLELSVKEIKSTFSISQEVVYMVLREFDSKFEGQLKHDYEYVLYSFKLKHDKASLTFEEKFNLLTSEKQQQIIKIINS